VRARLLQSESLRSAFGFALGGVGFAAGNILLARVLPPDAFGIVALVLALNQFGVTFGPLGLEVVANRHRPRVDRRLALYSLSTALLTGIIAAIAARLYYGLSMMVSMLLLVMIIGSATNRVCVALFQGDHRMRPAMAMSQVMNYVLLGAAMFGMLRGWKDPEPVIVWMMAGFLISSAWGWKVAHDSVNATRHPLNRRLALHEGLSVLGVGVGVQILMQFERLAIPKVGTLQMLGLYAVLAAIAGSAFRMIEMGNAFTLLPRLRAVSDAAAARTVIRRESLTAAVASLLSAIAILVVAPLVFDRLLAGKFAYDRTLIIACIVVGFIKVWSGFATTVTTACGTQRMLVTASVLTWISIGLAIGGAVLGARFGLIGILYGVGAAWLLLACGASYLALRSFLVRFGHPSRPPVEAA